MSGFEFTPQPPNVPFELMTMEWPVLIAWHTRETAETIRAGDISKTMFHLERARDLLSEWRRVHRAKKKP
jgi:hypothetical protein